MKFAYRLAVFANSIDLTWRLAHFGLAYINIHIGRVLCAVLSNRTSYDFPQLALERSIAGPKPRAL